MLDISNLSILKELKNFKGAHLSNENLHLKNKRNRHHFSGTDRLACPLAILSAAIHFKIVYDQHYFKPSFRGKLIRIKGS